MSRFNFLSIAFLALFSFVGFNSAQAQIFCNGTNGCPSGYSQIEVTNNTNCDYDVVMYHEVNASPFVHTCTVPANGVLVICYDPSTTQLGDTEVVETSTGNGGAVSNPGYPGSGSSAINNGGCGGNDVFTWQNFSSTGPGHVTNYIIK